MTATRAAGTTAAAPAEAPSGDGTARAGAPVASPCRRACALDASGICAGCGRSLDEIAGWSTADEAARRAVVARAARRMAAGARRFARQDPTP